MEIALSPSSDCMRAPAAAAYLGISVSTLAKMRLRGDSPIFTKVGPRRVLYLKADLEAYLQERRRRSNTVV